MARFKGRQSAAEYLDCEPETVDRLRRSGRLRGYRRGGIGRWIYSVEDLDACVQAGGPSAAPQPVTESASRSKASDPADWLARIDLTARSGSGG